MKNRLIITCEENFCDGPLGDFVNSGIADEFEVEIRRLKNEVPNTDHFDQGKLFDIVLYIEQHTTELLTNLLIGGIGYDLLKNGLVKLIDKLSTLKSNKQPVVQPRILVTLSTKDIEIEMIFEGYAKTAVASQLVNDAISFINSSDLHKSLSDPELSTLDKGKKRVRLLFNKKTRKYELENFGEYRKRIKELQDHLNKNVSA